MVIKIIICIAAFLSTTAISKAQSLRKYAEANKTDSIKINQFISRNKLLIKEYQNVLVCSCVNEYIKESISKGSDSCFKEFPDLGSMVFNEKLYTTNLREINSNILSENIQRFNSEVVKFQINKDKEKDEYNVLQVPFLSRCMKIVNQYQLKYYKILIGHSLLDLIPWLYR